MIYTVAGGVLTYDGNLLHMHHTKDGVGIFAVAEIFYKILIAEVEGKFVGTVINKISTLIEMKEYKTFLMQIYMKKKIGGKKYLLIG